MLLCASSGIVPAAAAEEDAKAGAPPALRPGALHLDVADAWLGLESEYEQRRVRYSTSGRGDEAHDNRDSRLNELFGLDLAGDVIDPNLLAWQAGLEIGPSQNRFREEGRGYSRDEYDSGLLLNYDVAFDILKSKPVSVHGYARRGDDRVARRFLPSLREEFNEYGLSVQALYGPLTTEAGFEYRDVKRHGNDYVEDDERLRTSRVYIDNKLEISDSQWLRLGFEREKIDSSYQGSRYDFNTTRDEFRLEHEYAFGPDDRNRFDTVLRTTQEDGDLERDETEFTPRLILRHTDALETIYRYSFYHYAQDAIEVDQHKFDAQAQYRPSDRFRFSLNGFGLYERVDQDVETRQFGGGFDTAYTRPTPAGELRINLAFAADGARTVGDAGYRVVRDEGHALSSVRSVRLDNRDVQSVGILAHNKERTRYYIDGKDYVSSVVGRYAYVKRLRLGRIQEGEVVYFDYRYRIPAGASVTSYRGDLSIEHEFPFGLTPYYYLESRCQDVSRSFGTPAYRDDMHRHRVGARYEKPRWDVTNEIEIFDDSVEPFDAYHLTGHVALLRAREHSLDFSGEVSRYWFEGGCDRRRVWWLEFDLKDKVEFNAYLSGTAGAAYHFEDDSIDGRTHGVDLECGLRYVRGLLTVELTAEYDLLSFDRSREDGFGVWLNVRRDLGSLLPASRREP